MLVRPPSRADQPVAFRATLRETLVFGATSIDQRHATFMTSTFPKSGFTIRARGLYALAIQRAYHGGVSPARATSISASSRHPTSRPTRCLNTRIERRQNFTQATNGYSSENDAPQHPRRPADEKIRITYDDMRHQIHLRSPSDVLRRRFFGDRAIVRGYLITDRMEKRFEREEEDGIAAGGGKPAAEKTLQDHPAAALDATSSIAQEESDLSLNGPDTVEALICEQLLGCNSPSDVLRVYRVSQQNHATAQVWRRIEENGGHQSWLRRFRGDPDFPRVLSIILRDHETAVRRTSAVPVFILAGIRSAAENMKLEVLSLFMTFCQSELQTNPDPRSYSAEVVSTLLKALRSGLMSPAYTGVSEQEQAMHRQRISAVLPSQSVEGLSRYKYFDLFSDSQGLTPDVLAGWTFVRYYPSKMAEDLHQAWERVSTSPLVKSEQGPKPIRQMFMTLFLMHGDLSAVWNVFKHSGFEAGTGDVEFDKQIVLGTRQFRVWEEQISQLDEHELALWTARKAKFEGALDQLAAEQLEKELEPIEEALGIIWNSTSHATPYHATTQHFRDTLESDENRISKQASLVLARALEHGFGVNVRGLILLEQKEGVELYEESEFAQDE